MGAQCTALLPFNENEDDYEHEIIGAGTMAGKKKAAKTNVIMHINYCEQEHVRRTLPEGEINNREFLRLLKNSGYQGSVCIEKDRFPMTDY